MHGEHLTPEETQLINGEIGIKSECLSGGVAQLWLAVNRQRDWEFHGQGVFLLVKDKARRSYFFEVCI
jgi:hypothetical protein